MNLLFRKDLELRRKKYLEILINFVLILKLRFLLQDSIESNKKRSKSGAYSGEGKGSVATGQPPRIAMCPSIPKNLEIEFAATPEVMKNTHT